MRVVHIITSLGRGGAPGMLLRLCKNLNSYGVEQRVIVLGGPYHMLEEFERCDISVLCLNIKKATSVGRNLFAIKRHIKEFSPDVISSWMYHANIVAAFYGMLLSKKVVWGVRHTPLKSLLLGDSALTALFIYFGAYISKSAAFIVYCSENSSQVHNKLGYSGKRAVVIENGFEVDQWFFSQKERDDFRRRNRIPSDAFVFGHAGRSHEMKNQQQLVMAFNDILESGRDAYLLIAGRGHENLESFVRVNLPQASSRIMFVGQLDAMRGFYNAVDVFLLTSKWGESFPNVLVEAALCGCQLVTTRVGGSVDITLEKDLIIEGYDHVSISSKMIMAFDGMNMSLVVDRRSELVGKYRERFDINLVGRQYLNLYESVTRLS